MRQQGADRASYDAQSAPDLGLSLATSPQPSSDPRSILPGRLAPTSQNRFIQSGLALWVIYGFHRCSTNYLPINVNELRCWI